MVIPRMTLRLLFLPELAKKLPVDPLFLRFQWRGVVCKNTAHVMQKPCCRQQNGRVIEILDMVKEKLGIKIALRCR